MKAVALTAILLTAPLAPATVRNTAQQVASWQVSYLHEAPHAPETDWTRAAFYIGLARWAATPGQRKYFDAIRELGERTGWQIANSDGTLPIYSADDHAIGQVYIAAYDRFGDRRMIEATVQRLEYILQHPPQVSLEFDNAECMRRWCWSDAIFMGPATWFGIARIQKDRRFRDYADREFWATKDVLFDSQEHLFYRDSRFIGKTGEHGEKILWGRGNGWVLAGLANILRELRSGDPLREKYVKLFVEIADRVASLQRPDGFWSTSLLAPHDTGTPESSCTGLLTYGLAAGMRMGLLDAKRFSPVVKRGWQALASATTNGRLGRVQPIGDRPDAVQITDTQLYGSGALLLAASELVH
ncbi:glycoside hydrolase family 88 protein [Bradyrhizobium manausense]|uniref:glycoside hydrolase family 88/105 protein n=1 Tax=Bradyrhizobium TaxID=374 RepID=UPI001BADC803|nr:MULTISPECIES: glycoside hydrolase family 88 protein [Bradyrhizobium]MBR0824107.1 glycoside hydrolase family 88 protein [Bradyrhizobium manausense]UVO26517.1 glycoside hydrolase family 88 protein [Bradyrhizobium arachidis]